MRPNNSRRSSSLRFHIFPGLPFGGLGFAAAAVALFVCGAVIPASARQSQVAQATSAPQQPNPHSFYGRIVSQNGVRYILRDDEENVWYHLDDQEKAGKLFGKDVLVTGTYDGVSGAIHVQNIVQANPQARPRPPAEDPKPVADPPKNLAPPPAAPSAPAAPAMAPPQAIPADDPVDDNSVPSPKAPTTTENSASTFSATNNSDGLSAGSLDPEDSPGSFFALSEEPVSATSNVAISSRKFILLPTGSAAQTDSRKSLRVGRLLRLVGPSYPEVVRQQGIEGTVRLRAFIAEDGSIQSVETLSGPPPLVEAATVAVREWRYSPTLVDGRRVRLQEEIRVTFRSSQ